MWYGIETSTDKVHSLPAREDSQMRLNWPAFWSLVRCSSASPSLVWNMVTLEEISTCLVESERNLDLRRQLAEQNKKFNAHSEVEAPYVLHMVHRI